MAKKFILLAFITLVTCAASFGMQKDSVLIIHEGQRLFGLKVLDGELNLYAVKDYILDTEFAYGGIEPKKRKSIRYFLECEKEVKEVTANNYKEIVKKYLPNAPDLHERLGKKGFRFENIYYMVRFYNQFRSEAIATDI